MKSINLIIVFMLSVFLCNAQIFKKNDGVLSVGYGYGNINLHKHIGLIYNGDVSRMGPFYLRSEYFISKNVSLGINAEGAILEIMTPSQNGFMEQKRSGKYLGALVKTNWHWLNKSKIALYSGIGAGYYRAKVTLTDHSSVSSTILSPGISHTYPLPIDFELTVVGMKYMINNAVGFYGETGLGRSLAPVEIGLTFRVRKRKKK